MPAQDIPPQESLLPRALVFEWVKVAGQQRVPAELLALGRESAAPLMAAEVRHVLDHVYDCLVVQMRTNVLGTKLPPHTVTQREIVQTPATTFQMFKARHASAWWARWFVDRWPVVLQDHVVVLTATWEQMAIYPWQDLVPQYDRLRSPRRVVNAVNVEAGPLL